GGLEPKAIAPDDIVHFRFFDPCNPNLGFPMLETLRLILAEEAAAGAYRRSFWQNGARFEHVITRPKDAPKWEPDDRQTFRKDWQEFAGKRAGMSPVLEDGMDIKPVSQNFRDSEYLGARKLTREECAAAYHVPLPMVGILEHATFSNIKEQHKQLYQDCLGPWLTMLEEELELQLLPEFDDLDADTVYLEFNIAEKLKGSFEEQASSLSQAVGRPYMTANEARGRLNLPRHTNPTADDLADVAPGQGQAFSSTDRQRSAAATLRTALEAFIPRQVVRLTKDARAGVAFNHARWTNELAADIRTVDAAFSSAWGEDADRVASIINSETWDRYESGTAPWPDERLEAVIARFADHMEACRG
ncbi:MAG TPA: phage portal protein, partial [Gemmatimonadales bacterium]|nr:phage portal protein [Gemmatimonadales bacterium]